MKEILIQLASYNLWANQTILDAIKQLPEEKQLQEVASSFNSIYKTVVHMWDAETIWWQRIKLQERIIVPGESFKGNTRDAGNNLLHQDRLWLDWISNAQEHMFQHVFQYQNSKREHFKQPVFQMLIHLFNHSTYHRGQLVTLMRQVGLEKIPGTDFIIWTRKKN